MIIECINIETGIFFLWNYDNMRLSEAKEENGFSNICMLKKNNFNSFDDWLAKRKLQRKYFEDNYNILNDNFYCPSHIKKESDLLDSLNYQALTKRFEK